MLSASYEFSKKGTSCKCADTKQICVFLPFPSDLFSVSLFLRKKNFVTVYDSIADSIPNIEMIVQRK